LKEADATLFELTINIAPDTAKAGVRDDDWIIFTAPETYRMLSFGL
jgi:hypothetical protein